MKSLVIILIIILAGIAIDNVFAQSSNLSTNISQVFSGEVKEITQPVYFGYPTIPEFSSLVGMIIIVSIIGTIIISRSLLTKR